MAVFQNSLLYSILAWSLHLCMAFQPDPGFRIAGGGLVENQQGFDPHFLALADSKADRTGGH